MVIMPAFTIHVFFLWVNFSNISLVVQHNFTSEFVFNPNTRCVTLIFLNMGCINCSWPHRFSMSHPCNNPGKCPPSNPVTPRTRNQNSSDAYDFPTHDCMYPHPTRHNELYNRLYPFTSCHYFISFSLPTQCHGLLYCYLRTCKPPGLHFINMITFFLVRYSICGLFILVFSICVLYFCRITWDVQLGCGTIRGGEIVTSACAFIPSRKLWMLTGQVM